MLLTPLKSIEEEMQDSITAFKAYPDAKHSWRCHHELLAEMLTESFMERIIYIRDEKPEHERALRFRNFRPVKDDTLVKPAVEAYSAAIKLAYKTYNTM